MEDQVRDHVISTLVTWGACDEGNRNKQRPSLDNDIRKKGYDVRMTSGWSLGRSPSGRQEP